MKNPTDILVVEDNASNMLLIATVLKRAGYRVIEADTAAGILDLARRTRPALILMDIALPGLDGLAATRLLKADDVTRRIPVLAVTAHAMRGDEEKALEAGCDGYVTKPINTRTFAEQISRFVPNGERR